MPFFAGTKKVCGTPGCPRSSTPARSAAGAGRARRRFGEATVIAVVGDREL
jgi:hypothetical protein